MRIILTFFAACFLAVSFVSCGAPKEVSKRQSGTDLNNSGFAIATDKMKDSDACRYSDMYEYLRGRIAGVEVLGNNSIRIRGVRSLNSSNDPLIIVDGIEHPDLDDVDPMQVETVEVLKDGSTALYGVKGANGVIIITLKH